MSDLETITSIGGALRSMQDVLNLAKRIKSAGLKAEFQERILDLQGRLLEVQSEVGTIRAENERLHDQLALRHLDYRSDGMYWDGKDGPFCPGCVDGKGIRARVARNSGNGFYVCEVCKNSPQAAPRPASYR